MKGIVVNKQHIALVTGANRGIGKDVASQLAYDHGLKVFVGSREPGNGQAATQQIGYEAEALQLDVPDQNVRIAVN